MIILNSTQHLDIQTIETPTTPLNFLGTYADSTDTMFAGQSRAGTFSNSITTAIPAPPAGTSRAINDLLVYSPDSTLLTVEIYFNDSGTATLICRKAINPSTGERGFSLKDFFTNTGTGTGGGGGGGATFFTGLADVAVSYAGNAKKIPAINPAETGLDVGYTVGTAAGDLLQLDSTGKIPAVDGSQLTNLPAGNIGTITALTGDVTASGSGSVTATIANAAVTLPKITNVAANCLLGNLTGSPAAVAEITNPVTVKTFLAIAHGDVSGLGSLALITPTGTADSTTYLRGDGSWSTISAGATAFTALTDVTISYEGNAKKIPAINVAENGLDIGYTVGTAAGDLVQLDSTTGKLPAIDGSLLTNLPSSSEWTAYAIQSASFSPVSGGRYPVDTSSGSFPVTLPSTANGIYWFCDAGFSTTTSGFTTAHSFTINPPTGYTIEGYTQALLIQPLAFIILKLEGTDFKVLASSSDIEFTAYVATGLAIVPYTPVNNNSVPNTYNSIAQITDNTHTYGNGDSSTGWIAGAQPITFQCTFAGAVSISQIIIAVGQFTGNANAPDHIVIASDNALTNVLYSGALTTASSGVNTITLGTPLPPETNLYVHLSSTVYSATSIMYLSFYALAYAGVSIVPRDSRPEWILQTTATSNVTVATNWAETRCDTSGGSFTITLPSAAYKTRTRTKITDAFTSDPTSTTQGWGHNHLTVAAPSGYTVRGASTYTLNKSSVSPEFVLNQGETDWYIDGGII